MDNFLSWMESSALGQLMRDSTWLFPTAEIFHFVGLSLLIGSLMVVDLKLLGVIKHLSLVSAYRFLPLSIVGFGINLVTGVLFCFTDPFRYYPNFAFRLKMLLIVLAGLNALWFKISVYPVTMKMSDDSGIGPLAKTIAMLSLVFWFAVIVMGRWIPYVE